MDDDARRFPGVSNEEAETLLTRAVRCRRLAAQSLDRRAGEALRQLATECELQAAEIVAAIQRGARPDP